MPVSKTTLATLAALVGYTIFGISFMAASVALSTTTPMVLLAARFAAAFLALNLIILLRKIPLSFRGKPLGKLLLLGLVQSVVYYTCENYGIAMTSTSFSGTMLGTIPVFGLLLGWLFLKEQITPIQGLCALVSIVGVGLTSAGGTMSFSPLGAVLLLTAAASSALFNVLSRDTSRCFSPVERTYVMFAFGCAAFPLIALFQNRNDLAALIRPLTSPSFWSATLFLALFSSVGAFLLLNYANGYLPASRVSLFTNFATVISVLLGIFVMGDDFSPLQIFGIVLIIISVCTVSLSPAKK